MDTMLLLRLSGLLLLLLLLPAALLSEAATLALYNRCRETVWPGIQPSAGKAILARGGFRLLPNQAYSIRLPTAWSGRVWGRQGCSFDPATSRGRCATGDCGGNLFCNGIGGSPPATLAEVTLGQGQAQDFYDVSLVDGYNLGISMTPFRGKRSAGAGGGGRCAAAGCVSDLNAVCPAGLAVRTGGKGGRVVGCKSACSAFGSPRYCCTGSYGGPQQCKPTSYSRLFKAACPRAYSYAYDDATSILTCSPGVSYLVTFCPHH
uniref:LOW QUALITY PROTEIN: thaumatin-like protein n=1 Tax=Elaeis guineensis var. tenera TaxID=51953 RepID=A0A6I9RVQ6_ELAGV|nr:LOW QUALITY PROTEIN: thaumatin-like protein [Elaeis guineensis]